MAVAIHDGTTLANLAKVDSSGNLYVVSSGGGNTTGATVPAAAVYDGLRGSTALPTAVSDGQLVGAMGDKEGRTVVTVGAPRELLGTQTTQIASSASETTIVTAGGGGIFKDITGIQITNATATAVSVTIKDSTSGTTRKVYDLAASGGIVVGFNPPLPQATAANNWTATLSSGSVTVDINVDFINNK